MIIKQAIVFFDIETSVESRVAVKDSKDVVTQIAAVSVNPVTFEVLDMFESKILFDMEKADKRILTTYGYSPEKWEGAKDSFTVAKDFINWLKKYQWFEKESKNGNPYYTCIGGGHNIGGFDIDVMLNWFISVNQDNNTKLFFPIGRFPRVDTMELICAYEFKNNIYFPSHKLPDLCEHFGITLNDWHNAMSDVLASVELAKVLKQLL